MLVLILAIGVPEKEAPACLGGDGVFLGPSGNVFLVFRVSSGGARHFLPVATSL